MRDRLQAIVEIDEDFIERQHATEHHPVGIERVGLIAGAAFFHDQRENVAHRVIGNVDTRLDRRFADVFDRAGIGQVHRVVHLDFIAAVRFHPVHHTRVGRNDIDVMLAANALLDDFHVEQTKEAAAETKPEGDGALGGIKEGGVVEA